MPGSDTVNLTIRSTIKKIDEMAFQCPITWTIYQLKTFVAMTHKQGQDYFKPTKTHFYFGGNPLNDEETIETVLRNRNLKHRYTFIAKFIASLEAEDSNKQSEEEETDKMRILDEHFRLFMNPVEDYRKDTNMGELESLVKLPLMVDSIAKQVIKRESEENPDISQQDGINNEIEEQEERNLEQQYIIKLAIRILIVFFLFKSHFHGALFYIFLAVLAIYCLIKLSQRRVKQRRVVPQNQPRPAGAPNPEAQNPADNQQQQQQQPQQPAHVAQQNHPTLANKIKEFVICFVSSFYPSWDMNLYIENNPIAQPEIAPANSEENTGENNAQTEENNTNINQNNEEPKPVETETDKTFAAPADPEQKLQGTIENTNPSQLESTEGPM